MATSIHEHHEKETKKTKECMIVADVSQRRHPIGCVPRLQSAFLLLI